MVPFAWNHAAIHLPLAPSPPLYVHSFMMEYDIHTVLDGLTLVATGGVIFCMLLQPDIRQTYQKDQDKLQWYLVVGLGGGFGSDD